MAAACPYTTAKLASSCTELDSLCNYRFSCLGRKSKTIHGALGGISRHEILLNGLLGFLEFQRYIVFAILKLTSYKDDIR